MGNIDNYPLAPVSICGYGMFSAYGRGNDALDHVSQAVNNRQKKTGRLAVLDQEDQGIDDELAKKGWRATLLSIAASRMALEQSGYSPEQTGIIIGTSLMDCGGFEYYRKLFDKEGPAGIPPWILHFGLPLAHASHVAVTLGLKGECTTYTDPVVSGLTAIGHACRTLWSGRYGFMLAGGVESPTGEVLYDHLCEVLRIKEAYEGCCILLLSNNGSKKSKVLAQVPGFSSGYTGGDEKRRIALVTTLIHHVFPGSPYIDIVFQTSRLPEPLRNTLAAGPAFACCMAMRMMNKNNREDKPAGWPKEFFRNECPVERIAVIADSPGGQTAVLIITAPFEKGSI
jgi:hypothetical protein